MIVRAASLSLSLVLGLGALTACGAPASSTDDPGTQADALVTGASIASLARANVGHRACGKNSEGGTGYDSSCTGNGGLPEYWCADFARWVWAAAGVKEIGGLTAAAGSFYVYDENHGTLSHTPHVGDAVVFDYKGGGVADHVAIVSQVNGDGTIESVSGDWGGQSGSEAHFSATSSVVLNAPAYAHTVGSAPGIIGMTISGFISPAGVSEPAAPPVGCNVGGEEGTCIETSACAAKGGYKSTPGYCPGAADIQCCTKVAAPAGCGELKPGEALTPGQEKSSCDGVYTLAMQTDGNLVLYHNGKGALWATGTNGKGGHTAIMQTDGNFVLYNASSAALWNSKTWGHAGAYLAVQDDGNLVVYEGSKPEWASGTNGR
jgi:hypothetical protein